ncbi:hypothetical protein [uncultured Sphingomonas sp.]|uniref:hypothetical protein n=1 Tax=uncultured Sphingomonas sp. TaxID=158754 RepID=UPI0025E51349|nr:hypothetical protein [uncultured Sphingomonas sp.]
MRPVPTTPDGIFAEAVRHWGSSTEDVAMFTVIDGNTGVETLMCGDVDSLAWAVAKENGLIVGRESYAEITRRMLAVKDRRFTFSKPEALKQFFLASLRADADKEVCSYIRKGIYAFRGDRPAAVYIGEVHG